MSAGARREPGAPDPPGTPWVTFLMLVCLVPQEYGVPFMETSAKSGLNVELAFTAIAK